MKKRIIIILVLVLSLTGCTIDYSVKFDGDIVNERISGYVTDKEIGDGSKGTGLNIYYDLLYSDQYALTEGEDLYTKNIIDKKNKIQYEFSYVYDDNYNKSMILDSCYENVFFDDDDDFYYIYLSGDFYCMYADKININVTSEYAIIDSNANKIKDNNYIWIIKDQNDADINLTISKTLKHQKNNTKNGMDTFRIIAFVILIILSIITYLLYKKKNSDEI